MESLTTKCLKQIANNLRSITPKCLEDCDFIVEKIVSEVPNVLLEELEQNFFYRPTFFKFYLKEKDDDDSIYYNYDEIDDNDDVFSEFQFYTWYKLFLQKGEFSHVDTIFDYFLDFW